MAGEDVDAAVEYIPPTLLGSDQHIQSHLSYNTYQMLHLFLRLYHCYITSHNAMSNCLIHE